MTTSDQIGACLALIGAAEVLALLADRLLGDARWVRGCHVVGIAAAAVLGTVLVRSLLS